MVDGDWVYSHSLTNRVNHRVGLVTCFGCTPLINGFIHLCRVFLKTITHTLPIFHSSTLPPVGVWMETKTWRVSGSNGSNSSFLERLNPIFCIHYITRFTPPFSHFSMGQIRLKLPQGKQTQMWKTWQFPARNMIDKKNGGFSTSIYVSLPQETWCSELSQLFLDVYGGPVTQLLDGYF